MIWLDKALEYATLAVLVLVALTVAFCAEDAVSFRTRLWSVRTRWTWAAQDAATVAVVAGRTVFVASTRSTALRLLREVIGDLVDG